MRKYNKKEAVLQKWKKILSQLVEESEQKQSLMAILDSKKNSDSRYLAFNQQKEIILQNQNDSFWAWLWSLIVSLFYFCWPQKRSPSLEELLLTEVLIEDFGRLSGSSKSDHSILENADFEEAVFNRPELALADIQYSINFLPNNSSKINQILERLEAIKLLLSAGCYQTLLTQLYKKYPLETLNYQYKLYIDESEKFVGPEEFLEYELMSQTLMDLFILPLDTDPLNQRCFAIQELFVLLALSNQEKAPLAIILADAITNGTKPSELFKQLGHWYEITKSQIIELMPDLRTQNSTMILEDLIELQNNPQHKIFCYQPLFLNLARLACQELLLNYHQYPKQQNSSVLQPTIEFLSSKILNTWSDAQRERKNTERLMTERKSIQETIFSCEECCAILSIFSQTQSSDFNYQNAIFYSNQLVMASLSGVSDLRSNAEDFDSLKPHEKIWVLFVIERLQPKHSNSIDNININLNKTYDQSSNSTSDNPNRFSAKPLSDRALELADVSSSNVYSNYI